MGIYAIQLSQWVFQREPKSIKATGTLNVNGVDSDMQAEIKYGDNEVAHLTASSLKMLSNTATIRGTKGEITVNKKIGQDMSILFCN